MLRRFSTLIMILLSLIFMTATPSRAAGSWESVGNGPVSDATSSTPTVTVYDTTPQIALAPDGTLYALWVHGTSWIVGDNSTRSTSTIYIKRFNGSDWEEVGAGSASGNGLITAVNPPQQPGLDWVSVSPTLVIAQNGVPYVAWIGGYNNTNFWYIYLRRFNGGQWAQVCGSSASGTGIGSGFSEKLGLAVHTDETIYLTWNGIQVRRCAGGSWEDLHFVDSNNPNPASGKGVDPSLALSPDGTPYVGYEYRNGPECCKLFVRRWNGSGWEVVGDERKAGFGIGYNETADSNGPRHHTSLALDSIGTPYLAWEQSTPSWRRIYIRRLVNGIWEEVGQNSASRNTGISTSVDPGCDWHASRPYLMFAAGDIPYISWTANQNNFFARLYLKRFQNGVWQEVSSGSACGDGLKINDALAGSFSIASNGRLLDPLYVGWSGIVNGLSTNPAIHVPPQSVFVARLPLAVMADIPLQNYFTISTPVLTWRPLSWATGYQVQIARDRQFQLIVSDQQLDASHSSYQAPALRTGFYYWRIRGRRDATHWGTWSALETFIIDRPG